MSARALRARPGNWKLPVEITTQIAGYLSDVEICHFVLVCKETAKVTSDGSSLWRHKFTQSFDLPKGRVYSDPELKKLYTIRRKLFRSGQSDFTDGNTRGQTKALKMLVEMIQQANPSHLSEDGEKLVSMNLKQLYRFAIEHNLLENVAGRFRGTTNTLLQIIQLFLSHLILALDEENVPLALTYSFEISQKVVYASIAAHPIFIRDMNTINVEFLLHVVNFFKHHFTVYDAQTAWYTFTDLPLRERPQGWDGEEEHKGGTLGKKWKGSFAYLDHAELSLIRQPGFINDEELLADKNIEDGKFQTLYMEFPVEELEWPRTFEHHLQAFAEPKSPRAKAQHRNDKSTTDKKTPFCFFGDGEDDNEQFYAQGYIRELPPQHGIAGFKRVVMMKFYTENDGAVVRDSLWAYEGVMLPGGKIIVGRWWAANDEPTAVQYSGPFIFWSVPEDDEGDFSDEAVATDAKKDEDDTIGDNASEDHNSSAADSYNGSDPSKDPEDDSSDDCNNATDYPTPQSVISLSSFGSDLLPEEPMPEVDTILQAEQFNAVEVVGEGMDTFVRIPRFNGKRNRRGLSITVYAPTGKVTRYKPIHGDGSFYNPIIITPA